MINLNNKEYFAHRGIYNNINIPENSLSSFKKATINNCNIELDLELTKDATVIVFHDENLKRMTGKNILVKDLTYQEIKLLKLLGTDDKIPTFKEVLELVKGKVLINIEIKKMHNYKTLINNIIPLLNNYQGRYIFQSFSLKSLIYLKHIFPNIKRGLLISSKKNFKIYKFKIINILYKLSIIDFISINRNIYSKKISSKYPTLIWTIKNKEEISKFNISKGYICDNLPYKK